MGKEKNKLSGSEQLAHDIAALIDGKPNEEILTAICVIVANICIQSPAPDVIAYFFYHKLKDTISEMRKVLYKTNKINSIQ